MEAAKMIDVATCEIMWWWGQTLDPYGVHQLRPEEEQGLAACVRPLIRKRRLGFDAGPAGRKRAPFASASTGRASETDEGLLAQT